MAKQVYDQERAEHTSLLEKQNELAKMEKAVNDEHAKKIARLQHGSIETKYSKTLLTLKHTMSSMIKRDKKSEKIAM